MIRREPLRQPGACAIIICMDQASQFALTGYIQAALASAVFDKLEDASFSGRIPSCRGVIAFGGTLQECERELQSALEDWILVGLKLNHPLPVLAGIDLNKEPTLEPVDSL